MTTVTIDEFKEALPVGLRAGINQAVIDQINDVLKEPEMMDEYRDNLLSFTNILSTGKYKIPDFVNAVKYVSYKLGGLSNQDAYIKTFPHRYQSFLQNNTDMKDIASYISAYARNKLVTQMLSQSMIPVWLVNQDNVQKAVNKLVTLMNTANSEKVQCDAATSLLNHLKQPEATKLQVDISVKKDETMETMKQQLAELTAQQLKHIQAGSVSAGQVIGLKTVKGETV